ncbi:hypothetical protein GOBAR_DD31111 [Gossypium barbadense]|nr:hypothetical protein GOBAR_DD31111 [Gossypium barbadense]
MLCKGSKIFATSLVIRVCYLPFVVSVKWFPPRQGWKKLKTNGSSFRNLGRVEGEVVIRGQEGSWVKGTNRYIPKASSIEAKPWALRGGLKACY